MFSSRESVPLKGRNHSVRILGFDRLQGHEQES